jgi:hypothetical protein
MEQNFGPHIPQNSALLKYSAGRVSSWYSCCAMAAGDGHVVVAEDLEYFIEVFLERVLFAMVRHPHCVD